LRCHIRTPEIHEQLGLRKILDFVAIHAMQRCPRVPAALQPPVDGGHQVHRIIAPLLHLLTSDVQLHQLEQQQSASDILSSSVTCFVRSGYVTITLSVSYFRNTGYTLLRMSDEKLGARLRPTCREVQNRAKLWLIGGKIVIDCFRTVQQRPAGAPHFCRKGLTGHRTSRYWLSVSWPPSLEMASAAPLM
jgi:hypothetical protein